MSACFLGNFEQALKYGKEALELFEELGHRWEISCSLSRIGFAYIGMGLIDFAQENFRKALEISDQNQMEPLSLYALAGLCCVMMKMGQEKPAFELINYVKHHPKTPKTYLEQAYCVANELCRRMAGKKNRGEFLDIMDFSLAEVINRYLDSPEIIRK
jgi:tetratricopeptide (TPR) repeat protein